MNQQERELILRELHRSLDERWRPEEVAQKIVPLLDLDRSERQTVEKAAQAGQNNFWSSMSRDFHRPHDMSRQLTVAEGLFGRKINFVPDDVAQIEAWLKDAEQAIGKQFGRNDFKADRMPKPERLKAGIDISRRQYNKRFRLAVRLERKVHKLRREQFKRALTLASKNRLAADVTWEDFSADLTTACFIAYYVARCNLRSLFTNTAQARPYDEICDVLMQRCNRQPTATNWWAIAHLLPIAEVVGHLDDEQQGVLLASYFNLMHGAAQFLEELWEANEFNEDMVVRRGNDSTTWNVAAGAWNKLRDGWFSLMYALGMLDAVERMCPGKVLRLMAADVAWWHLVAPPVRRRAARGHPGLEGTAPALGSVLRRCAVPEGPGGRSLRQARSRPGQVGLVGTEARPHGRAVHADAGVGAWRGRWLAAAGGGSEQGRGVLGQGSEARLSRCYGE